MDLSYGKNSRDIAIIYVSLSNTESKKVEIHFISSFLQQYSFCLGNKKVKFVFQIGNSANSFDVNKEFDK